jgi:polysaccharide biosynthesis/export protein
MGKSHILRGCLLCCMVILSCVFLISAYAEISSNKEYILGPEDMIQVKIWGNDDLNREIEISREGDFTFPLIEKIHAAGLSVFELERVLRDRLSEGFFVKPQITVSVTKYKSQKVTLLGEVKKPGSYVIKGKTNILELISEAGGPTDEAGRIVTIIRPVSPKQSSASGSENISRENVTITVDLDKITGGAADDSFFSVNGDSIYINKVQRIFITGEVNKPGEFKWDKGLTVHQAIALAGGATKRGAPNRTSILRTESGSEKEIKPDLSDAVLPNDIVKVPQSYF